MVTLGLSFFNRCRSRVVLPQPMPPVITVNPALFVTPNSSMV